MPSGDAPTVIDGVDISHEIPSVFNSRTTVEGILIPFTVLSWICVTLRIWTRFRLQCLGWDDLFVVIFRVSGMVGTVFTLVLFNYGFGKHFATLGPFDQVQVLQKYYVALLSYTISTTLMKLCLLLQYLRVFSTERRVRIVCWVFIVIVALWGTTFTILAAVPCVPVPAFWDRAIPANCFAFGSLVPHVIGGTYAGHVSSNVFLDLVVLAIPIPLYYETFKLKKQRIGFTIMILLGISINVITIWRLHTIIETRAATYPIIDPTFYGPQSIVLASVEVDLASIVASIPVFWPMLTETWGGIFVTQEILVTHHHRRLSGEDDRFELRTNVSSSGPSSTMRVGSEGSLKQFMMYSERRCSNVECEACGRGHPSACSGVRRLQSYDPSNPFDRIDRSETFPIGAISSNTQVVSERQRGFERAHGLVETSMPLDRFGRNRKKEEQGANRYQGGWDQDRSYTVSVTRGEKPL
ncbi:hypothetical protein GGS21DRAFT_303671 [Xylaria nigripes]|nr:hypothetical protein GGS21DRAFT_303671 [Xylaria nigripes]